MAKTASIALAAVAVAILAAVGVRGGAGGGKGTPMMEPPRSGTVFGYDDQGYPTICSQVLSVAVAPSGSIVVLGETNYFENYLR